MQALRLLGYIHGHDAASCQDFIDNGIVVRSWLSLAFPTTEIQDLELMTQDAALGQEPCRYLVTTTDFGLYSTLGPLPTIYTEELLDEFREDNAVSRDFLDILNNHLAHLRFAAWQHNKMVLRTIEAENSSIAHVQFCLMGQSNVALRPGELPDVYLAEVFARGVHSKAQTEIFLNLTLDRDDVEIEECLERHALIPEVQHCRLGQANATLGSDVVLGQCVRDSTAKFRIHFKQVAFASLRSFLPGEPTYIAIQNNLHRFLDAPLSYDLAIHPDPDTESEAVRLGQNCKIGFYLGKPQRYKPITIFFKGL